MQHCRSRSVVCIQRQNGSILRSISHTGCKAVGGRLANRANESLLYTQKRHGMFQDFITNKLSFAWKVRGVKARQDFKPKGKLVYKAKQLKIFRTMFISSSCGASVFTCIGCYDLLFPIEGFAQSPLVMICGMVFCVVEFYFGVVVAFMFVVCIVFY